MALTVLFFPPGNVVNTEFKDDEIFLVDANEAGDIEFFIEDSGTWRLLNSFENQLYASIKLDSNELYPGTFKIKATFTGTETKTHEWTWNLISEPVPLEFDLIEPAGTSLNMALDTKQDFKVSTTLEASISWYLDEVLQGSVEGQLSKASFISEVPGVYSYKVEATAGTETISHTWTITVPEEGNGNEEPDWETIIKYAAIGVGGVFLLGYISGRK